MFVVWSTPSLSLEYPNCTGTFGVASSVTMYGIP